MAEESEQTQLLPVRDELGISSIEIPDMPNDVIFPDEINRYLRDRVMYLSHENGMLRRHLDESRVKLHDAEAQVTQLDGQMKKQQSTSTFVSAVDVANGKLVDLARKLRDKTAEMEVYKTKCGKLEKRLLLIELEMAKNSPENAKPFDNGNNVKLEECSSIRTLEQETTIKALQDKLHSTTSKLFEAKNVNVQLQKDIKMANKLLQQEVGENLEVLQGNTNWRGRAQIICDLQDKNNDLKEKLRATQDKGMVDSSSSSKNSWEKKVDSLTQEKQNLSEELQTMKRKWESSRNRCKFLDMELVVLRTKLQSASEHNAKENERVNMLTKQLTEIQTSKNEAMKSLRKQLQKEEATIKMLQTDLEKHKCAGAKLQTEINNKNALLQATQDENQRHLNTATYDASNETSNLKASDLARLEAERLRLLELVDINNKRLEEERSANQTVKLQFVQERQKAAKLESKVARLQLELNCEKNSTSSTYSGQQSAKYTNRSREDALFDRLEIAEEQIKVLNGRLQIERQEKLHDFSEFRRIILEGIKNGEG